MTQGSRTIQIECSECEPPHRLPLTALAVDIDWLGGEPFMLELPDHPTCMWKAVP